MCFLACFHKKSVVKPKKTISDTKKTRGLELHIKILTNKGILCFFTERKIFDEKMKEQFKNNFNKYKLLNTLEDSAVISLLGNGLVFQAYKQLRTKQDLNKTIKTKTLLNSKKFILKKIYSKKSKW